MKGEGDCVQWTDGMIVCSEMRGWLRVVKGEDNCV